MQRFWQNLKAAWMLLGIISFCFAQEPVPKPSLPSPKLILSGPVKPVSSAEMAAEIERQERALAQTPDDKKLAENLYQLYRQKGWRTFWDRQYEEAQQTHQKAKRIDQKYKINEYGEGEKLVTPSDVFLLQGWDRMANNEHSAALQAYQEAIRLDPTSAEAHYELGRLFIALGQKENAENQVQILRRPGTYFNALGGLLEREIIRTFLSPAEAALDAAQEPPLPASATLRPKILYQEKAKYTESARQYRAQGTVILSVVLRADGRLTDLKIVRGLPLGLTETALEAAEKIRFSPAMKDGKPVSINMKIEFTFNLL